MSFMDRSIEAEGLAGDTAPLRAAGLKLVIQVPCYNEEATLARVLEDMPREIDGIAEIEIQVIDDGSSDRTVEIALANGVHHIVRNRGNKGLARTFQAGVNNAIAQGADIIVNTDGDHQYPGRYIADLVRPIVEGRADVVVGDRRPGDNLEFSLLKRFLQRFGTRVVRHLSGVETVSDAVSGFRAYSRTAALKINVMTRFSYTTETLIHAGQSGLTVLSVPVETNSATRPSRLFTSMSAFLRKQVVTILRSFFMYRQLSAFLTLIGTAKLNNVDPQAWLADVLARIAGHPAQRLDDLLPWNWCEPNTALAA